MSWLLSVYIGATVFGVGVTLIDMLGLLGDHGDGHSGDHFGDHADAADGTPSDGSGSDSSAAPAHDSHEGQGEPVVHSGSVAGHDAPERPNFMLGLLSALRNVIYFCLGFGPIGWFALSTSGSAIASLAWSVPIGGVALIGTRVLRRFMRRDLNSEISTSELLMERGVITVSIAPGELGKVRAKLGDLYVERFARATAAEASIRVGSTVRITEVTDDCVYVEEE